MLLPSAHPMEEAQSTVLHSLSPVSSTRQVPEHKNIPALFQVFRGFKSRRYLLCFRRSLREVKGFALQGAQRTQKKKVKKSCFRLPESCSQSPFHRDAGVECSHAPYTAAPAHGISSHILQEKGELSSSVMATLP